MKQYEYGVGSSAKKNCFNRLHIANTQISMIDARFVFGIDFEDREMKNGLFI